MSVLVASSSLGISSGTVSGPDWELDFYSRSPIAFSGKKRWELIICSTPNSLGASTASQLSFRWEMPCPVNSVNSLWLKEALEQALFNAKKQGFAYPRRLRSWRSSMRTMVQRAAESFGLEFIPSRRCYALTEWLREREDELYPEIGYSNNTEIAGSNYMPLPPIPLPTAVRGDSWTWASLPIDVFYNVSQLDISFTGLLPVPNISNNEIFIPGVCLISNERSLAIAAWLEGLEPVKLKISNNKLVLEAGLEDRWLLTDLSTEEAAIANKSFQNARINSFGLQFLAVQQHASQFDGLWMMRDFQKYV